MKNKLSSLQTLIAALTIGTLAWDVILCLTRHERSLPHKDMALTGSLLWLVSPAGSSVPLEPKRVSASR